MNLSIIIPVYNAEKYLKRCLNSIVEQLKDGTELILIDDGSSDASHQICDDYADRYAGIRVEHQENTGEGAARNRGMELAEGEWITFVDADDYVSDCFVDTLQKYISQDLDLILFEYVEADETESIRHSRSIEEKVNYYDEDDREAFICANFMARDIVETCNFNMRSVWAKAYRRKQLLQNQICFVPEVKVGEDMLFTLMVYNNFNRAACVSVPVYNYFFRNEDSVTNQYKPDFENIVQSYVGAIVPWLERYPQYEDYHAAYRMNDIILYIKYDFFHNKNTEDKKNLHKRMKRILVNSDYKKYYQLAKERRLLAEFYGLSKRIVFWLALHGHFRLLRIIAYIKYGT